MDVSRFAQACDVCGSENLDQIFLAKDRNRGVSDRQFAIVRCRYCGTGRTVPSLLPEELARYYPVEYFSLHNNLALEKATRPYNRLRVQHIQRYKPSGRLIDIGAGTGMFLRMARECGFDVEGLEISAEAATFGRNTWALPINQGDLRDVILPPEKYDVVTLAHVFEHLPDPHGAARKLFITLKHGGLLAVAVPNFASLQARVFRSSWFHLDVPRHLYHYTPTSMRILLEQAGFHIHELNFFSAEHNWAGILGSMMALSRPDESVPHKIVRKLVGQPLARVLAFVESVVGKGGTFEIYAIKP